MSQVARSPQGNENVLVAPETGKTAGRVIDFSVILSWGRCGSGFDASGAVLSKDINNVEDEATTATTTNAQTTTPQQHETNPRKQTMAINGTNTIMLHNLPATSANQGAPD